VRTGSGFTAQSPASIALMRRIAPATVRSPPRRHRVLEPGKAPRVVVGRDRRGRWSLSGERAKRCAVHDPNRHVDVIVWVPGARRMWIRVDLLLDAPAAAEAHRAERQFLEHLARPKAAGPRVGKDAGTRLVHAQAKCRTAPAAQLLLNGRAAAERRGHELADALSARPESVQPRLRRTHEVVLRAPAQP
jgi:hypothetical protein